MSFPRSALALFALATLCAGALIAGTVIQTPAPSSDPNPIGTAYGVTPLAAGPTFPSSTDTYAIYTRPTLVPTDVTYWVVSKSGTSILRVLNNTFQPVQTVNLGTSSTAAAMSPNGQRFVIITGNTLRIFDAATIQQLQIGNLDIGLSPTDVVISPDSKRAFIMDGLGQKVTAVDLTTNAIIGTAGPFVGISSGSITFGPNGMLYVSAPTNNNSVVYELNPLADPFDLANSRRRQFSVSGKVGKLHFTPDGTRALAPNENTATGVVLYLFNIADSGGGSVTLNNSEPIVAGVTFDKIYILGNSLAYAISSGSSNPARKIYQIQIPDLPAPGVNLAPPMVSEPVFGSLGTPQIAESLTYSREYPLAKKMWISSPLSTLPNSLVPSVLYEIDVPSKNKSSEANLPYVPGFVQYVDPVQTANTATVGQVLTVNPNPTNLALLTVSLPFGVKVLTAAGEPIFGLPVTFATNLSTVTFEGGNTVTTNADGFAFVRVKTPNAAGAFSITATPTGSSFTTGFSFTVGGGTGGGGGGGTGGGGGGPVGSSIEVLSGDGQIVASGNPSPYPMKVRVVDAAGNPQSNVTVTWTITQGVGFLLEGTLASDGTTTRTTTTDATGTTQNVFQTTPVTSDFGQVATQTVVNVSTVAGSVNMYMTNIALIISGAPPGPIDAQIRLNGTDFFDAEPSDYTIRGKVGQTITGAVKVRFTYPFPGSGPIPNAGIQVENLQDIASGPGIKCIPKPVPLSGNDGIAVCDAQLIGRAGQGAFKLIMGANRERSISLIVTPGDPTNLVIVQGNGQSVKPGETATAAFQARVTDAAGNGLQGYTVRWQILSGAATFVTSGNTFQDTTSNATGIVAVNVKAGNTPGAVQIRAQLLVGTQPAANFGMTIVQTATTLRKPTTGSGDNQSAFTNANFPTALVVEVLDASSLPVQNASIDWSIVSGAGTLTGTTPTLTGASGRAQMTVRAGSTAGTITVRAAIGNLAPVTFTLTVNLPGPVIGLNSFRNTASGEFGALTPGGLVTISGDGIAQGLVGAVTANALIGPWPTRLNGVEVQFGNTLAPIYRVANIDGIQSVTVQAPYDLVPGAPVAVVVRSGGGSSTVNGVPVVDYQPGLFETIDQNNRRYAVAIRPNGTYVTPENPARTGEVIRVFVTGIGQTTPAIAAGQTGSGQRVLAEIVVGLNDQGVRLVSATYAMNLTGLYEIAFEVPAVSQTGNDRPLAVIVVRNNGQFVYGNGSTIAISQ
ncbi:MAG: hypothetical protein J0L64_16105 [Acidobacteria bacterium]|nr:hypothetical protein [Acidobacteriota bacterium]